MRKTLNVILIFFYIIVFAELVLISFSKFFKISTLEKLKYANDFVINNNSNNVYKSHRKNFSDNIMGVDLRFNSLGFRGTDIQTIKELNEKRIMVLGSSLVMGWGVKEDKTFTKVLEKKINVKNQNNYKINTVNTGIMHTNTKFHYHLFQKNYKKINPDILILGYFVDDAKELSKKKTPFIVKYSYLGAIIYQKIVSRSSENLNDYYLRINNESSKNWLEVKKYIKKIKEICDKEDIDFVVIILPDFSNFSDYNSLGNLYTDLENRLNDIMILNINPYKTLQVKFGDDPRKSWISNDDNHPNEKANEIIADEIYTFINNKKLILKNN